jgi:hypothetical protein
MNATNPALLGFTAAVKSHGYRPHDHSKQTAPLRELIDFVARCQLRRHYVALFRPIAENLQHHGLFLWKLQPVSVAVSRRTISSDRRCYRNFSLPGA